MIIPKYRVCDICFRTIDNNVRCYRIKSKMHIVASGGECNDNKVHDVCEDCMGEFEQWVMKKYLREQS